MIGNTKNRYGRYLENKYRSCRQVQFAGPLFEQDAVHTLRKNCLLYFHGHSVGGTNPSLLEAMASGALIAAHGNDFNKNILGNDAFYFNYRDDIPRILKMAPLADQGQMKENNSIKIKTIYNKQNIIEQYERYLMACLEKRKNEKIIYHQRYAYK